MSCLHFHLIGEAQAGVERQVQALERMEAPGKVTVMTEVVLGHQFFEEADAFQSHSHTGSDRGLQYFGSVALVDMTHATRCLAAIRLVPVPGSTTLELERTIGIINTSGIMTEAPIVIEEGQGLGENRMLDNGLQVEMHHCIDLPPRSGIAVLQVAELTSAKIGPVIGNWCRFINGSFDSFRSTTFLPIHGHQARARHEHAQLRDALSIVEGAHLTTMIEHVIGIWHLPGPPASVVDEL